MPRFGLDGILQPAQIKDTAQYVLSLSGHRRRGRGRARIKDLRRQLRACHGEDGKGNPQLGAPNLTDELWLYGGKAADIEKTIRDGARRRDALLGGRLDPVTIKMLTVYVHALGGGRSSGVCEERRDVAGAGMTMIKRAADFLSGDRTRPRPRPASRPRDGGRVEDGARSLRRAPEDLPQARARHVPQGQVGRDGRHARHLLPRCPGSAGTAGPTCRTKRSSWISPISGCSSAPSRSGRRSSTTSPAC